jgi:hypothetical protein
MTHPTPTKAGESLSGRIVDTLERSGDALMRAKEVKLAQECYALSMRIRYVTPGLEPRHD